MKTTHEQLLQQLRWRYATQKFDPARIVDPATWAALEQSLVLTASSFGLQPWKFAVITDPQIKQRLVACSYNQSQVRDASHVVVFAIRKFVDEVHVDRHIDQMTQTRSVPRESLDGYRRYTVKYIQSLSHERAFEWAARQAYLALGSFLTAAAILGVDTCPMEGIDPDQYDTVLDLPASGFSTVVVCCAGYRDATDKYATTPKVRFDAKDIVQRF